MSDPDRKVKHRNGLAHGDHAAGASHGHASDHTQFTAAGPIPPVASGTAPGHARSASDRAYGGLNEELPPGIDVHEVRGSVDIPGGRKLTGNWLYSVTTRDASRVNVEVTHEGVRVYVNPPLFLDVMWPGHNCLIEAAGMDFTSPHPWARVTHAGGLGSGLIPTAGTVAGKITDMIAKATHGTKLVDGKYDPGKDPELSQTLDKVMKGVMDLFAEDDKKHKHPTSPVDPKEMKNLGAGATVSSREEIRYKDPTSMMFDATLVLGAGTQVKIDADGSGNLSDAIDAKTPQAMAESAHVQTIHVSSEGLLIYVQGKPFAKLESVTFHRGGKVTVDHMTPLGELKNAEGAEAGLSLLGTLMALGSHHPSHGTMDMVNGMYRNSQHPQLVGGVTKAYIEANLADGLRDMLHQYRNAVPGMDLMTALGMKK